MKLGVSRQIFRKSVNIRFIKISPVVAELFHADVRTDGLTDITKLIVAFRNLANTLKNLQICVGIRITVGSAIIYK
jgi:hypothetical protein